jgi:hypothetical protein
MVIGAKEPGTTTRHSFRREPKLAPVVHLRANCLAPQLETPKSGTKPTEFHTAVRDLIVRTETRAGGTEHQSVTDYPSPQSDLANPQRDNRRRRHWDPRPSKWGHRAPHSKLSRREDNSDTNAGKPVHRSIGARGWLLDASHHSNHWTSDTSLDPATRPGPLLEPLEPAPLLIPIRERAFRSPAGLPSER